MASVEFGISGIYMNKELVQKTPMKKKIELSLIDRIESIMGHFEKALDYAGTVPGISTLSGAVRVGYGLTQLIIAIAMKSFAQVAISFAKIHSAANMETDVEFWQKQLAIPFAKVHSGANIMKTDVGFWQKLDNRSWEHVEHGLLNIGRGFVESIPVVNRALAERVRERDILVYDCYDGIKVETFVNTSNKEDLHEFRYDGIKHGNGKIWFSRFYYEGELKRMHLNVQEEANKHLILKDDTNIVLNPVV